MAEDAAKEKRVAELEELRARVASLEETEERYRALFNNSMQGYGLHEIVLDDAGKPVDYRFLEVNDAFEALTGLEAKVVVGKCVTEVLPGIEETPFIDIYGGVALTGEPVRFEEYAPQLDRYYDISAFSPRKGQFVTVFSDITVSKRAAQAVEERNRELVLMNRVVATAGSTLDVQAVLEMTCSELALAFGVPYAAVALLNDERTVVTIESEYVAGGVFRARGMAVPLGDRGISEQVLVRNQPLVSDDVLADERFEPLHAALAESGVASMLLLPLAVRDDAFGALVLATQEIRGFSQREIDLAVYVATAVSQVLHNARLYQAEREQHALSEAVADTIAALNSSLALDEVLDRILVNVERVVAHDAANIMLLEEDGETVSLAGRRGYTAQGVDKLNLGLEHSLSDLPSLIQMREREQPLAIPHTHEHSDWIDSPQAGWIKSYVGAPICHQGEVIGFLNLDSATPGFYNAQHAERLQVFADQAALAIANARLYEAEREQRALAEALADTAATLNKTLDLEQIIDRVLDSVTRIVPHGLALIMLLDEGVARIVGHRGYEDRGIDAWLKTARFRLDEHPDIQRMVDTGQPLIIQDTRTHPTWTTYQESEWIRSHVSAPISVGGTVIGFINLDSTTPNYFTPQHGERLLAFANEAAVAIQNARLYRGMETYNEFLEDAVNRRTAELLQEKEQVEAILNSVGDGILIADTERHVVSVNPAFEAQTGYRLEDFGGGSGDREAAQSTPPQIIAEAMDDVSAGHHWRGEMTLHRKDGTEFEADIGISPVMFDGELWAYVGTVRDISAQKEVERMKDAFISNVSHEFRTPLTGVKLYLSLLETAPPEKHGEYLEVLNREVERLQLIIEDVLSLTHSDKRQGVPRLALVDLNALAAQQVSDRVLLAAEQGLTLDFGKHGDLPLVMADEKQLGRALGVLLTNALTYTPQGGTVNVGTKSKRQNGRAFAGICVCDDGPGIPADEKVSLFKRFFRGEAGRNSGVPGTGLGLSIAWEIVQRQAGHIDVKSEGVPGKGSSFTLWLPAEKA